MARPRAPAGSARVLLSTAPPRVAGRIARALVTARVAACVNVVPGVRSTYRWRGKVEETAESLLVVKTTARALPACLRALRAEHPYELPEALVLVPGAGEAKYLAWIAGNCTPTRA